MMNSFGFCDDGGVKLLNDSDERLRVVRFAYRIRKVYHPLVAAT